MRSFTRDLAGAAALALSLSLAGCAASPRTVPAPLLAASAPIDSTELRRDLFAFAADSMRGRETGTPDAYTAALFLAHRVEQLGLVPQGDSGYFQRVPLQRDLLTARTQFAVTSDGETTKLRLGDDVTPLYNLGPGAPEPKRAASGDLVFAGYGSRITGRDDLEQLVRLDTKGKVLVVIHGAPAGVDSATRAQLESQAELSARIGRMISLQPAAIIVLTTGGATEFYHQIMPELLRSVSARTSAAEKTDAERPIPMIVLGVARPGSPLLPAGWPDDAKPQVLTGRTFSGTVEVAHEPFMAYNIVAMVPGVDKAMANTYVAYGAHYDHIGVEHGAAGDSINNGADDDGSGSMSLLAIARRMSGAQPKRSVLFVWHVGEEKGLLGSSWFTNHPTVPIDSIVAQLNADMIGRNGLDSLYIVGPNAAPNNQSKVLGAIVDSVNAAEPSPFVFDRTWDSQTHPEHIYERSDHFNYARKGIPIIFFTTGLHADYHKPGDEPQKIEYGKMARVARLMFDVGLAVADRATRPR